MAETERVWGFLRETKDDAQKAGNDKTTGLPRTGLEEYLAVIFPSVTDWIHDQPIKTLNGKPCRRRPDYRSESLKLIVEFDGIQHYNSGPEKILDDKKKTDEYINADYKVVRIPYFIQLTNAAVEQMFNVEVEQRLFDVNCPSLNIECSPACLCGAGIMRMAREFKQFPDQYEVNVRYLEVLDDECKTCVELLKIAYERLD